MIRRLFWLLLLFGAYIWAMTSGNDRMIVEQGKNLYRAVVAWFEDAEVDFQVSNEEPKTTKATKKRSRRWD